VYRTLESSPVAVALLSYLEETPRGYEGTVKRLLDILTPLTPQGESWPRSLKGFGDILRRLAPAFRIVGYSVIHLGHKRDGHHWQIKPINSTKYNQKRDHRDLCDRDNLPHVTTDIYNPSQNDQKTSSFDDTTKTDYFLSSCTRILNNEQENAPIDPNDKKVSCNMCEHYAWDCAKGIEVIDENALHNCPHFECVF
jgi:hypothetical protein